MTEGKIVQWTKGVGDKVSAGDILMVVESDKADMDVESFEDGYIAAILVEDGETAAVGSTVAIIVPNEYDSFSACERFAQTNERLRLTYRPGQV